jgi:hypothetical protein
LDDWQLHSQGVRGCPKNFEASRSRQSRLGGNKGSMPAAPGTDSAWQKRQPPGNIESEPAGTSTKSKTRKTIATTEGASKPTKASEALARRKVELPKPHCRLLLRNPPS